MPSLTQLAAAWQAAAGAPCSPAALRVTLAWDCAFVLAYTLWLAYPMAWALRRLVARAVPRGHRLAWLPRHAHWFMGLLAATDLAENFALLHAATAPWGMAAAALCAAKLACLALLAAVLAQGALAGPERARQDSAAGAGRLH